MQDMFKTKREGQANGLIFEFVVKTWVSTSKISTSWDEGDYTQNEGSYITLGRYIVAGNIG